MEIDRWKWRSNLFLIWKIWDAEIRKNLGIVVNRKKKRPWRRERDEDDGCSCRVPRPFSFWDFYFFFDFFWLPRGWGPGSLCLCCSLATYSSASEGPAPRANGSSLHTQSDSRKCVQLHTNLTSGCCCYKGERKEKNKNKKGIFLKNIIFRLRWEICFFSLSDIL